MQIGTKVRQTYNIKDQSGATEKHVYGEVIANHNYYDTVEWQGELGEYKETYTAIQAREQLVMV